jgi:hypothetical protein
LASCAKERLIIFKFEEPVFTCLRSPIPLLYVSREARNETLRQYKKIDNPSFGTPFYFNPLRDTPYIPWGWEEPKKIKFLEILTKEGASVRSLASWDHSIAFASLIQAVRHHTTLEELYHIVGSVDSSDVWSQIWPPNAIPTDNIERLCGNREKQFFEGYQEHKAQNSDLHLPNLMVVDAFTNRLTSSSTAFPMLKRHNGPNGMQKLLSNMISSCISSRKLPSA